MKKTTLFIILSMILLIGCTKYDVLWECEKIDCTGGKGGSFFWSCAKARHRKGRNNEEGEIE